MVYGLKILNSEATLNSFQDIEIANVYKNSDVTIIMQICQPEKKNIRYIPDSGAVITLDLQKSDGTVLTKTASNPFAEDRSIIQITLSNSETALLISQNLIAKIVEGSDRSFAILQGGFKMISLINSGC